MKAFILAAGFGSRLRPTTDNIPKTMVEVNGIPIIKKQIDSIIAAGIEDVFVVSGYKFDILVKYLSHEYPKVKIINNPIYETTNNMFSVLLTFPFADDDCIYMNGDVFFDSDYLKLLVTSEYENAVLVEKNRYESENMKIILGEKNIREISKKITVDQAYGTSIDVYKIGKKAMMQYKSIVEDYIYTKNERQLWNEFALNDLFKMDKFYPVDIGSKWYEIDNHEDLANASKLFYL